MVYYNEEIIDLCFNIENQSIIGHKKLKSVKQIGCIYLKKMKIAYLLEYLNNIKYRVYLPYALVYVLYTLI